MEDKVMNVETFPSGMMVVYDKAPADIRLQRVQCVLLPENWAQTSGVSGSVLQPLGLPQNMSPAQQQDKDKADSERAMQIAKSLIREQEAHQRNQRSQFLLKSLRQEIADRNSPAIQCQFDELLQLHADSAFSLLFSLVGGDCLSQVQSLINLSADRCCDQLDSDGRNALHVAACTNAINVAQALYVAAKQKFMFFNLKVILFRKVGALVF
jgi:hypothetical protein